MDWKLAQLVADDFVTQVQSGDGPGCGVMLFDETRTRVEAFGGLANLEHRIPFSAQVSSDLHRSRNTLLLASF
jgi:predicted RNA-binding Zn ribbon-like protein